MSGRIREYTREECPVCGHRDWCGRRDDGLVLCRRPPTPREVSGFTYKGMAKDGTTGMYVEVGREHVQPRAAHLADASHRPEVSGANASARTSGPTLSDKVDPRWLTENYPRLVANLTSERRAALAEALGLPVCAMDAPSIGWWSERRWWNPETQEHEGEPGCWTFPEYNAYDQIVGLGLRWPTGHKGQLAGGRRGIILPGGWRELADPVLVVEGPSDVLAGRAIGLNVVGRPNNCGGAELLAQVCRNRRAIIVGENDRKPDGRWPGQEGPDAIAGKLAEAWGRPVPVAYPPDGHKDLRAWVLAQFAELGREPSEADVAALRTRFLDAVQPPAVLLMAGARTRRGGKVSVKAFRWSDLPNASPFHSDRLDLDSAKARTRFVAAVAEIDSAVDGAERERRLLMLRVPDPSPQSRSSVPAASGGDTPARAEPTTNDRPRIQGNERQLRDVRNDALAALIRANEPLRLFSRAGGIARVALLSNDDKEAVPHIQQLDADALRGELTDAANWFTLKHLKESDIQSDDLPPLAVARDILALPTVDFPPLVAIITCPTFAPDGSLILANGYHPGSGLWHHRTLHDLPAIPERPSRDDILAARDILADILAEFPFVDGASRANAYALTLLPFVRPLIDGPTPMYAIDAPTAGTGKGLLVQVCLWPALGHNLDIRSGARDSDEWRKRITSELVAGKPVVGFDNATARLDSEHLAAVLTATLWTDRVLGQTRVVTIPNRSVWVCTGNNLAFSKELARRVVWIRLDAKVETPEQRTGFRHPNLTSHVRAHRAALVAAALTLCRAWLAAGRPKGPQVMGSFESYTETLGGILDVAGVTDFLANADELRRQADTETSEWRSFVHAWWERWHDALVGVSDLSELLWNEGQRTDLLPAVVRSESQRGAVTQLGRRLSAKRDCIIGGFRVVVGDQTDHKDRLVYRLVPTSTSGAESRHEVGERNSITSNDLSENADFRRLAEQSPLYACANETHVDDSRELFSSGPSRRYPNKSAEVGNDSQPLLDPQVARADFHADLPPTSGLDAAKSACRPPPSSPDPAVVHWHARNGDHVPPAPSERLSFAWRQSS
ncbi:MAG: hypothetical protein HZB38_15490 [Planctomycetes bacterium]|nr:hypothetical protein [Planctomycetota bacterium]